MALAVIVALAGCSASPEPQSSDDGTRVSPSTDITGTFEVGSRKIYLQCSGSGSPTVVLQTGFSGSADIWSRSSLGVTPVFAGVAAFTRVCVYDRPGTFRELDDQGFELANPGPGRSDPAPMPRSGSDVVNELHSLLKVAGVPGPYVMAGHSLGGLLSVLYAREYPDEIVGLVLVDATPPTLERALGKDAFDELVATPLLTSSLDVPDYTSETHDLRKTLHELKSAPPIRKVPVVMLVAGLRDNPIELERVNAAHERFAASIPGTRLTVIPDATHNMQSERPDAVISAIRGLI